MEKRADVSGGTLTLRNGQISAKSMSAGKFENGDYDFNSSNILNVTNISGPSTSQITTGKINNMIVDDTIARAITGTTITGNNLTVNTNLKVENIIPTMNTDIIVKSREVEFLKEKSFNCSKHNGWHGRFIRWFNCWWYGN